MLLGPEKPKTCSANKEKTTPNKTEDCSKIVKENFILISIKKQR
jgi:hypothetical protein